jgi:hypothetical protein
MKLSTLLTAALLASTLSGSAFASDVGADRYWKQQNVNPDRRGDTAREQPAQPGAPSALACACAKMHAGR